MSHAVLVAYATRYGSTQEVAEAVAQALRQAGLEVDLQPLRSVASLSPYRAVVMGAPLYMFRWHQDALRFLARHQAGLQERPVAVFALGPFNDKEEEWQEVRSELDKALAQFPWLAPAAITVFGGKFDPASLRFPFNLVPGLKKMPVSDIRDWTAIGNWAASLVTALHLDAPAG